MAMTNPIRVGVSACLLGQPVRYDGGHKLDRFITDTLGRYCAFVPVCPEAECGLGIPREPMHLAGDSDRPRLVTNTTGLDLTQRMRDFCARRMAELANEDLAGFIFKSKSPSCGLARVKVQAEAGALPVETGTGLFARAFQNRFPHLPVTDEDQLQDADTREHFIERIRKHAIQAGRTPRNRA